MRVVEENERGVAPPLGPTSVPGISFAECSSGHSSQPDPGDSGDGEYDDGPEYLAIGNLGSRRLSRSSTHSSDHSEPRDQSQPQGSRILPPQRRSSFSEGQKGPGRGLRGHARSFSDTGINAKLRSGKKNADVSYKLGLDPTFLCINSHCSRCDGTSHHCLPLVFMCTSLSNDNSFWMMSDRFVLQGANQKKKKPKTPQNWSIIQ